MASLQWLDLAQNQITAEGVIALAEALKTNKQMKFLGLARNPFGEEGIDSFLELIGQGVLERWRFSSTLFPLEAIARSFAMKFTDLNYFSGSWIRQATLLTAIATPASPVERKHLLMLWSRTLIRPWTDEQLDGLGGGAGRAYAANSLDSLFRAFKSVVISRSFR